MAQGFSLADQLFNAGKVAGLGQRVAAAAPGFAAGAFAEAVMTRLPELELKARIGWIAECLDARLPRDFDDLAAVILAALPPSCDPGLSDGDFGDFIYAPLGELVVRRGLDRPERALDLLEELTQRFSMEYAIRPFLNAHEDLVFARLAAWCGHPHYHVRRLVSEGTRPRLPWGVRLPVFVGDPGPVLGLLEELKDDPSEYVRRSVANNLNDIAKDHPDLAARTGRRWLKGAGVERRRLVGHGLRTLVKNGHPTARDALGFVTDPKVEATLDLDPATLPIGGALNLTVGLRSRSRKAQRLVVDYAVHHLRANGKTSAKVFKIRVLELAAGERIVLAKKHSFAPRSVRRYYAGVQEIELLVGGRSLARRRFELTD